MNLLLQNPKRYSDLKGAVSSDKTLAERLKELEECTLIETISMKSDKRSFIHYKITQKGIEMINIIKQIIK